MTHFDQFLEILEAELEAGPTHSNYTAHNILRAIRRYRAFVEEQEADDEATIAAFKDMEMW